MYQLILVTNAFLRLIDKREEKTHICYPIRRAVSKAIRQWLNRYS